MNYISIAFNLAGVFLKIIKSPGGKDVIDALLDIIEDIGDDKVDKTCAKIRKLLKVPDND